MPAGNARRWILACLALGLITALTWCPLADSSHSALSKDKVIRAHKTVSGHKTVSTHKAKAALARTLFGTLDTQISDVETEKKDGLSVAMFELDWIPAKDSATAA
jgi:hypothetical protein